MTKMKFSITTQDVGQFSNTCFLKPIVRWEVHGTNIPTLLANQIPVTSKITLPVTVSISDFLPFLTERNNVRCRFIVKLIVNKYQCTWEEMTFSTIELWQKARQNSAGSCLNVWKATDSAYNCAVYLLICLVILLQE